MKSITDHASRIRLQECSKLALHWKNGSDVQFADMTSYSSFFDIAVFLLSGFGTGPSFMAISLLGMALWQFLFITEWPKIWKSEILLSEFCPISGDRGELGIPKFGRMFLMTSYWMLQNCRVTAFTVSELIRENQQGSKNTPPSPDYIH